LKIEEKNNMEGNNFVHSTLEDGEDLYLTDQWKRKYHFKMASFPVPIGMAFETIEVRKDSAPAHFISTVPA